MENKTILITGSTSGIGLAGAQALGRLGWRVLIHARTKQRGQPVVKTLAGQIPEGRFDLVTGDLASLEETLGLAEQVRALSPALDVLWNNAGLLRTKSEVSTDGFDYGWAVNHLAGFALTNRLLPSLRDAPQGRVVLTSSFVHLIGRVPDGFQPPARYNGWQTYGDTKLANVLFARELAKRLSGTSVTAHAFHPGYVRTSFGADETGKNGNKDAWFSFIQKTVEQGADTGVYLAAEPIEGNGLYWSSRKVRRGSPRITDANASRLWELTEAALARWK